MVFFVVYIYEGGDFMTESDFWMFLTLSQERGRIPIVSGYVDSDNSAIHKRSEYIGGHSVLFEGHDKLPVSMIQDMGRLILEQKVSLRAKEAILMILAHHPTREALDVLKKYNENPDKALKYTSLLALQECEWWNE